MIGQMAQPSLQYPRAGGGVSSTPPLPGQSPRVVGPSTLGQHDDGSAHNLPGWNSSSESGETSEEALRLVPLSSQSLPPNPSSSGETEHDSRYAVAPLRVSDRVVIEPVVSPAPVGGVRPPTADLFTSPLNH